MSDEQERLVVEIEFSPEDVDDISKLAGALIIKHQDDFLPFLCRLIQEDARYTYIDESLEIEDITINGDRGEANVTFTSDFYAGCRDQNGTEEHDAVLPFVLRDGLMIFDLQLPQRWDLDN